jgi:hypothetical protein
MNTGVNIAIAIVLGMLTALIAKGRGRSPLRWFVVGLMLGFFGIIFLFFLPSTKKETFSDQAVVAKSEVAQLNISPPTQNHWFFLDPQKNIQGPVSLSLLKEQWNKGLLTANSWVWNESLIEWKRLEEVQVLFLWIKMPSKVTEVK